MEVGKGDHGGSKKRPLRQQKKAMEVGKGGNEVKRRSWRQKKEGIKTEERCHGSKKRRAWR